MRLDLKETAVTRRGALALVSTAIGYLYGRPGQTGRTLQLPLDTTDAIVLQYRNQRVVIHPQELIDALRKAPEPEDFSKG